MKKLTKPLKGRISSKYGNRTHPVTGATKRFHNGIDIAGPIGAPIVSPADGEVVETYETEFGGLTLIINLDNGMQSRMCHLNKILVKKHQSVKEGQLIAECGNTGRSTGPHLHFGLKDEKRQYVNPELYL